MSQIVKAFRDEEGNYLLMVRPLTPRVSETQKTVQIAGTKGWAEILPIQDEQGNQLTAVVQIRRKHV
jgi:hypothetical protein